MNQLSRKAQIAGAARRVRKREIAVAEREAEALATLIRQVERRRRWHRRVNECLSRAPRT
jgi:hypothetical protein